MSAFPNVTTPNGTPQSESSPTSIKSPLDLHSPMLLSPLVESQTSPIQETEPNEFCENPEIVIRTAKSIVAGVTVFQQRAQIRRSASVSIATGENTIEFDDLPRDMDRASLQVSCTKALGVSAVALKGVAFTEVHTVQDNNARRQALEVQLENLRGEEQDLTDAIDAQKVRQRDLAAMFSKATAGTKDDPASAYNPEVWNRAVEFECGGSAQARAQQRTLERNLRDLQKRIAQTSTELSSTGTTQTKSKDVVRVFLTSPGAADIVLQLMYVVPQASWTAYYDVRVDSATRRMTVVYQALITQWTSEDWTDVPVELSTAQAHLQGTQPELQPWWITIQKPICIQPVCGRMLLKGASLPVEDDVEGGGRGGTPMAMPMTLATVSEIVTAFVFTLHGQHTITCNSQPKRVAITKQDIIGEFNYITVPKIMPNAYLQVKAPNTLGCPLLAGEVNVFMDNNYVTTSNTKAVSMGEDLFVSLGVDEGMVVKHKLLNRLTTHHGSRLSGHTVRVTYEHLITLRNYKGSLQEVIVQDQIPVSGDDSIIVTLLEPRPDGEIMTINEEDGTLEWKVYLGPGETLTIPLLFCVQYNARDNVRLP
jgi:uncharacterized protein (TIGR02231 family)